MATMWPWSRTPSDNTPRRKPSVARCGACLAIIMRRRLVFGQRIPAADDTYIATLLGGQQWQWSPWTYALRLSGATAAELRAATLAAWTEQILEQTVCAVVPTDGPPQPPTAADWAWVEAIDPLSTMASVSPGVPSGA